MTLDPKVEQDEGAKPQDAPDIARKPDASDVRWFYRLALAREAESDQTVADLANWTMDALVRGFFDSAEFVGSVLEPLKRGQRPMIGRGEPAPELIAWAAEALPLSPEGARAIRRTCETWADLYLALTSDRVFQQVLGPDHPLRAQDVQARLSRAAVVHGVLEEVGEGKAVGWIVSTDLQTPIRAELWIDDVFVGAAVPDGFRREVLERFGGNGMAGFEIAFVAHGEDHREHRLELRDGYGLVVDARAFVSREPPIDDLIATRGELAQVRALLQRIEQRLPTLETSLSTPVSEYGDYFERWYRQRGAIGRASDIPIHVLVDATNADMAGVEDALWSVVEQTCAPSRVWLLVRADLEVAAGDLATRVRWRGGPEVVVRLADVEPGAGVSAALTEIDDAGVILLMRADGVLAADAIDRIANRFISAPDLSALYFDEDQFAETDAEKDFRLRRHVRPAFKPGFDRDLLLQTPYCGIFVAFRGSALKEVGVNPVAGSLYAPDAVLRLGGEARVGHEPRVLATRSPLGLDADLWRRCVAPTLAGDFAVEVESVDGQPLSDIDGRLRIRRRPPSTTRATVIVPTRDRLDLLRPCIDSLVQHAAANTVALDLLVVDHDSQDPGTRAYLADLQHQGTARVLPYHGEFNWALMNNLAAAETDAEVLVFLNNDTVVLTPAWLDELVAQAMRPEIGPVGCRLLYGDGTIQHAGFVVQDPTWSFLTHEGVGQPGSEPGYLGRNQMVRATAAVTGACMAVRADVFRDLGGFEASLFPVEANDVDLCFRASRAGLTVLYTPHATLYHLESKTRGLNLGVERRRAAEATARLMWARWGDTVSADPAFNPHFDRSSRPFARLRPPPTGGDAGG